MVHGRKIGGDKVRDVADAILGDAALHAGDKPEDEITRPRSVVWRGAFVHIARLGATFCQQMARSDQRFMLERPNSPINCASPFSFRRHLCSCRTEVQWLGIVS